MFFVLHIFSVFVLTRWDSFILHGYLHFTSCTLMKNKVIKSYNFPQLLINWFSENFTKTSQEPFLRTNEHK